MDILGFLEARIAEDEAVATRAAGGTSGRWSMPWEDEARVEGDNMIVYDEGGHNLDQAEHIATHDPARVLAECAAKRAIIAEDFRLAEIEDYDRGCECSADDIRAGKCATLARVEEEDGRPSSTILRALASAYSDHPDYQQEWA